VGLYFVTGLYGSGLTDWLIDNRGEIYCVMFINPAILKMNLSEWLTWKENTAFRPDNPSNRIVINCGAGISGFSGILTHESTHAVDYVMNITPYVEPMTLSYDRFRKKKIPGITGFVKGIWNDYGQPAGKNDFHFRKQVHFYSNDPSKKIPIASGNDCYRELVNSPFVSLYGSKIWAEDLAELVLFFHITRVLWQPYEITVDSAGNKPVVYRPLENPKVLERFKNIRMFYEE
jgi:hypothetical protein